MVNGDETLSNSWTTLHTLVNNILSGRHRFELFEWGYYQVYRAVFFNQGLQLYKLLEAEITKHLISQKRLRDLDSLHLPAELTKMWKSHEQATKLIGKVFLYCDEKFVAKNKLLGICQLSTHLFKDKVVLEQGTEKKLKLSLALIVKQSRMGRDFDQGVLQRCCKMLLELDPEQRQVYEQVFETPFLQKTTEFYTLEARNLLQKNTCASYVSKVESLLKKEMAVCSSCLDPSTKPRLLQVLHDVLITNQLKTLVNLKDSGVPTMLAVSDFRSLALIYQTLKKVPTGPSTLGTCMSSFLRERGTKIVSEQEGPLTTHGTFAINYVQRIIKLKECVDKFLGQSFHHDVYLKRSTNLDFESFINANQRSPEYLSLYIDEKLKKSELVDDNLVEEEMAKALVIFRFLKEKDMFERYYKQHLAKRLLLKKLSNEQWELNMVDKLKAECGFQFTQNLEGMFKDMEYSATLMDTFKSVWCPKKNKSDFDVDVKVLSPNNWPVNFPPPACTLPPFASEAFAKYEEFYLQRHQHRKLMVNSLLGSAEILAHFYGVVPTETDLIKPRKYYLSVSTQQMAILDLFNQKDQHSFAELLEKTGLSEQDLVKSLTPMTLAKSSQQILTKTPAAKEMQPSDVFKVNEFYHSKSLRVRLQPVASRVESASERHKTRELVEVDRKGELEAAVVRIMKDAKTLHQNALMPKVIEQVKHRFTPTPGDIKNSIDSLCSREFIGRSEEDRKMIEYKP